MLEVKAGDRYCHYKSAYTVICVTEWEPDAEKLIEDVALGQPCFDTEGPGKEMLRLCKVGDRYFLYRLTTSTVTKPHVIYQKLTDEIPWARPVEIFTSDVAENQPRFIKL